MPGTTIRSDRKLGTLGTDAFRLGLSVAIRGSTMTARNRIKQTISLKDRLASFAREVSEKASILPPGPEQDVLIKKARQAETASHLDNWANSPGLQPPKWPG